MAGEWIKMRVDLIGDPAVFKIAEALGVDELHTIGCLFCFWSWADKHAVDGRVDGATARVVDKVSATPGLADAMVSVGWLAFSESGLEIPNFERHNGESAKERGLKNARQTRWRAKAGANVDAGPSTDASTDASTREEKKREEEIPSEAKASDGKPAVDKSKKPKTPAERAKADLWKAAVAVLAQGGCSNEAMARSFMGKLVTDYGLDAVKLAVDAAVTAQPADAREYLKATCQRHKGERRDPVTVPSDAPEKTLAMLESQRLSPEQRAASEEARRRVMGALKVVA